MRARIPPFLRNRPKSAISWARQWRALRRVAMNRIKLSIRVPAAQETVLRHIAEVRGLTRYQALARVIETGLGAIMHGPAPSTNGTGDDAFASLDSRLAVIEALTDRSLFTASAAYAYARRAALRNDSDADKSDSATSEAAQASYKRQRALAAEALS
jgi:D-serine deaminase-like pyridoxal phosphate-dependent protein